MFSLLQTAIQRFLPGTAGSQSVTWEDYDPSTMAEIDAEFGRYRRSELGTFCPEVLCQNGTTLFTFYGLFENHDVHGIIYEPTVMEAAHLYRLVRRGLCGGDTKLYTIESLTDGHRHSLYFPS